MPHTPAESISTSLRTLLETIRNSDTTDVRAKSSILVSQLDELLNPVRDRVRGAPSQIYPAIQLGYGIPKVRDVRTFVSEARALFANGQHHAAELAIRHAIERWEEPDV